MVIFEPAQRERDASSTSDQHSGKTRLLPPVDTQRVLKGGHHLVKQRASRAVTACDHRPVPRGGDRPVASCHVAHTHLCCPDLLLDMRTNRKVTPLAQVVCR
ncbi:hypothetical protein ElyMa_006822400 [Elysia marginata]|uniref:Uncharacterized protein n=1 Tax=Elysia marginata TaxID=1093978 RepID=A0AAV4J569_9GAST|nr:hypothetical protein ElyMa_006822400 [Elysia marginata]